MLYLPLVSWSGMGCQTQHTCVLWQPVDAMFGELLKVLIKQEHNSWLDCDENADRWYGNTEPFSAKERRLLITHSVGNAYNKLISQDYKPYV